MSQLGSTKSGETPGNDSKSNDSIHKATCTTTSNSIKINYKTMEISHGLEAWHHVYFKPKLDILPNVATEMTVEFTHPSESTKLFNGCISIAPENVWITNHHGCPYSYMNGYSYHCNGHFYFNGGQEVSSNNNIYIGMRYALNNKVTFRFNNFNLEILINNKLIKKLDSKIFQSLIDGKEDIFMGFSLHGVGSKATVIDYKIYRNSET